MRKRRSNYKRPKLRAGLTVRGRNYRKRRMPKARQKKQSQY